MRDWGLIEWGIAAFVGSLCAFLVWMVGNHLTSRHVRDVMADAYSLNYIPPRYEQRWVPTTNANGQPSGGYYVTDYIPEQWHIYWRAEGLTYDETTIPGYRGVQVGDRQWMAIRRGGWSGNLYLWER